MSLIQVPIQQLRFYKEAEKGLLKAKLVQLNKAYGTLIKQASALCMVPEDLILSFIFIESAGNAKAVSRAGAIGLMQLTPATASDMIYLENKTGKLSDQEKSFIRSVIGNRLNCILSMKYMGHKLPCNQYKGYAVTAQDLFDPAFNIYCGTLYLSILIRLHTENGTVRLDKVVVRYNRGYFVKPKGSLEEILSHSPLETKNYIAKLIGVNSPMDILTS